MSTDSAQPLALGTMAFSVEGRVLRELGERLVRQPDIALVELIKNSYDADATRCRVLQGDNEITVFDDGRGMTLDDFRDGWMRVGTSSKSGQTTSKHFGRPITGEKGIGRFAVRFLGGRLELRSVAEDDVRGFRTELISEFDWSALDQADLAAVEVPYRLLRAPDDAELGTTLKITELRDSMSVLDWGSVRSNSLAVVSPIRSLLVEAGESSSDADPGFSIELGEAEDEDDTEDLALRVLDEYTLRAVVRLRSGALQVEVHGRDQSAASITIKERYETALPFVYADIRFFPRRRGAFAGLGLDGRRAYTWIRKNSGVAVFDRGFRVSPYGKHRDDWLSLQADVARNARDPKSRLAKKHFGMSPAEHLSTRENWMLRLPENAQLIGVVEVEGVRDDSTGKSASGLIAAADREGFLENQAFLDLVDIIRGAVEAIAFQDRQDQRRAIELDHELALARLEEETQEAIKEIADDERIPTATKRRLTNRIIATTEAARHSDELARDRVRQLNVMSLMGVVAGFMTHEFGAAVSELDDAADLLDKQGTKAARAVADDLRGHRAHLVDYVRYTTAYVRQSANDVPEEPYPVVPRIRQVVKTFGRYARERGIEISVEIDKDLMAPRVPVALYNGVALNLFSNALKAVTAAETADASIVFRAWNDESWHTLEVSDTGVGVPKVMRERIFDPLFTTTTARDDPLGSGMGLGLALVRQVVNAFKGSVTVVDPPPGFVTTMRIRLPLLEG